MTPLQEQLIALGGVFQAAHLVHKLANTGQIHDAALGNMLKTLLVRNPPDTLAVYGGDDYALLDGYRTLQAALLRDAHNLPRESLRYALAMLSLEQQFARRDDLLELTARRLEQIERQLEHVDITSAATISACAALYQDTISTFNQRIQVHGDMRFLQHELTASKIRALLFAGIRSARLWRQLGGHRWQLLFKRRAMLNALQHRLAH
ncbi:high frequency lysogenization protein HflD [Thiopseudomonas acetoxidans]|uniref:High frequency lysogenization protein HflD homolog n=1 Tax=Thiopseudomonas acetoxidans TaxID=3041622 RepID=A0ABT7SMA0_9GAMM|nr:high frequency lysogenization protein HflD [Thiopseudomonas sp. CY1220]MDM7857322.1 high frequency lysogenization protein HflD [Thiopseudomonas sp. CY1220]